LIVPKSSHSKRSRKVQKSIDETEQEYTSEEVIEEEGSSDSSYNETDTGESFGDGNDKEQEYKREREEEDKEEKDDNKYNEDPNDDDETDENDTPENDGEDIPEELELEQEHEPHEENTEEDEDKNENENENKNEIENEKKEEVVENQNNLATNGKVNNDKTKKDAVNEGENKQTTKSKHEQTKKNKNLENNTVDDKVTAETTSPERTGIKQALIQEENKRPEEHKEKATQGKLIQPRNATKRAVKEEDKPLTTLSMTAPKPTITNQPPNNLESEDEEAGFVFTVDDRENIGLSNTISGWHSDIINSSPPSLSQRTTEGTRTPQTAKKRETQYNRPKQK